MQAALSALCEIEQISTAALGNGEDISSNTNVQTELDGVKRELVAEKRRVAHVNKELLSLLNQ